MRYFELLEGRDAPLYHFTRLNNLFGIVASDSLGKGEGVSLTRDANTPFFSRGFWNHVGLVLDQRALAATYSFEPRRGHLSQTIFDKGDRFHPSASKESEEFVDRTISPLSTCLTHIVLNDCEITKKLARYMSMQNAGKPMPKVFAKFAEFIARQENTRQPSTLDPNCWKTLIDYGKKHGIPIVFKPIRGIFGGHSTNLWHRGL